MPTKRTGLIIAIIMLLISVPVFAQDFDNVQYTPVKAADGIYMLQGAGGNIGLFFGSDGIFLIDDQFAPLHQKLIAVIEDLAGDSAIDWSDAFLINTHFHPDHTGGNELLGGAGAVIIAHENIRQRLTVEQVVPFFGTRKPALAAVGLPVITFSRDITFHLNGDSISVFHVSSAHTDGDAVVHFTKANVIHTGDILFMQTYPFIDLDNGGAVAGVILAVERLLTLADEQTKIIPGHGNMTDRAGLLSYHTMLTTTSKRVSEMVGEGKTLEEVQAAKLTQEFDAEFSGFITGDAFVGLLYRDLSNNIR